MPDENSTTEKGEQSKRKQSKKFLIIYGFALLGAAFLLVLGSYLTQIRAAREQIAEQSAFSQSALKDVEALKSENETLKGAVGKAEEAFNQLSGENETLSADYDKVSEEKAALERQTAELAEKLNNSEKTVSALTGLRNISYLYSSGKYTSCRKAIAAFEEAGLREFLPQTAEAGQKTPLEEYERIYDRLIQ